MTERDAFETRFHAALHGYIGRVASDLDPADLAHRIAVGRPRKSGLAARLSMPVIAVPRLAWLVLLVAGLLGAIVGGMLLAGSRPRPELKAVVPAVLPAVGCPAGSNPDVPGPAGQARPSQSLTSAMAFDRRAGRIVMLVAVEGDRAQTWTFDVCTNTWTRMADGPGSSGWDALVYDADSDRTITVDTGTQRVWAYDLANDTWTAKGLAPLANYSGQGRPRFAYDPVSGNVVGAYATQGGGRPDLWTYDVDTDTWTAVTTGGFSSSVLIAYDSSVDRLVVYDFTGGGVSTRLFDLRGRTWTDAAAATPGIRINWFTTGNEITYDEAARRTVIYSAGGMIAYDASADEWNQAIDGPYALGDGPCPGPRCRTYATTIYDPVNERLVVYGGMYESPNPGTGTTAVQDDGVLAYDLATRTWSVLLEPTGLQPQG